jgi:asparagine synthase (glutamine-hydrolysing)
MVIYAAQEPGNHPFDLVGERTFPAGRLRAMTGSIAHRGPDDERIHIEPGVAMGVRRLAIVDL